MKLRSFSSTLKHPTFWLWASCLFSLITSRHTACAENFLCSGVELLIARDLLLTFSVLSLCILTIYFLLASQVHFLPECVATILLGALVGICIRVFGPNTDLTEVLEMDPEIFMLFLLPGIIFEAGYSLEKGDFFTNIGGILLYAVAGTIISTVVIAGGMYAMASWNKEELPISGTDALLFGALISAVDPVATLAIFTSLNVNPTLHMLVFGESVVNDAVAIVLYRTFQEFKAPDENFNFDAVLSMIGSFLYVSVGSIFMGVAGAGLAALYFKYTRTRKYVSLETSLMMIFAYIPYLLAESLELSGIMCVLTTGIMMSYYTRPNLSRIAQISMREISRVFAFIAETVVFMYMGLAIFTFRHEFRFNVVAWAIFLCILGRMLNIYPLSLLLNRYRQVKISFKNQFIMAFAGLRGAIAFALSIDMLKEDPVDNRLIFTTTVSIVLFTIFVMGGGTLPLLKMFRVYRGKEVDMSKLERMRVDSGDNPAQYWRSVMRVREQIQETWMIKMDRKYFQNFFIRHDARENGGDRRIIDDMSSSASSSPSLSPSSSPPPNAQPSELEDVHPLWSSNPQDPQARGGHGLMPTSGPDRPRDGGNQAAADAIAQSLSRTTGPDPVLAEALTRVLGAPNGEAVLEDAVRAYRGARARAGESDTHYHP